MKPESKDQTSILTTPYTKRIYIVLEHGSLAVRVLYIFITMERKSDWLNFHGWLWM